MLKKLLVAIALFLSIVSHKAYAQDLQQQLELIEDSLLVTADSMYNAYIPDERPIYNEHFVKQLVRALKIRGSYNYAFEKLGQKINILPSPDNSFRIFNWLIAPTEVTRRYYGAIQMEGYDLKLYPLIDYTEKLGKGAEDSVLRGGKWYGALYYRIMAHEVDGRKVYTLFGLNAASAISNKKILDPLIITPAGPVFGAPIFNVRSQNTNERINRFIIEYKKSVQASMNWDQEMNAIYFDKLVSEVNDPNRKYTYVPSGEYDGFRWQDGFWNYVQNLIPIDNRKDGEAPAPSPIKPKE
jgi:hypothetical protein